MITEKDLKLEYLRDTGSQIEKSKCVEVEVKYTSNDFSVEISCPECEATFYEIVYPDYETIIEDVDVDIIDENFHNWCIEKLLEFKDNGSKESIL